MMVQYRQIKEQHTDSILFFRLGDFYEMFEEDAITVSALLNLTLTKRNNVPMCGNSLPCGEKLHQAPARRGQEDRHL